MAAALLLLGSLGSALGASQICGGLTPKTSAWEVWRGDAISMLVDTSACGFSGGAPAYAASVDQLARPVVRDPFLTEQLLPGSLTLLHVSATSFRAVMWDPARPLLKLSVEHGWAVSWMGSEAGAGAGVTAAHSTGWKAGDWGTIYADVPISSGASGQPFGAVPRLFTSLCGEPTELSTPAAAEAGMQLWRSQGGSGGISHPTTSSFRASLLPSHRAGGDTGGLAWRGAVGDAGGAGGAPASLQRVAQLADEIGWRVSWIAVPPSDNRAGSTTPDDWRNDRRRGASTGSTVLPSVFAAARYADRAPLPEPGTRLSFVCSVVAPHATPGKSVDTLFGAAVVADATPAGFTVYFGRPFSRHPTKLLAGQGGVAAAEVSHWSRAKLLEAGHLQLGGWRVEYFEVRAPSGRDGAVRQSLGGRGVPSVSRREAAVRKGSGAAATATVVRVDAAVRNEAKGSLDADKQSMLCLALEKTLRMPKGAARVAHVMEWDDHLVVEFHIRVAPRTPGGAQGVGGQGAKGAPPTVQSVLRQVKQPAFSGAVSGALQDANPEMRFDKLRFSTPTLVDDAPAGQGQLMVLGAAGAAVLVLGLVLHMGVKQGREIKHKRKLGHARKYRSMDQSSSVVPEGDEEASDEEAGSLIAA